MLFNLETNIPFKTRKNEPTDAEFMRILVKVIIGRTSRNPQSGWEMRRRTDGCRSWVGERGFLKVDARFGSLRK
jgi:hypothetical protein